MPDFAQVYSFIGSVFDPNETGHLERLKQMNPINLETVCYLDTINMDLPSHFLFIKKKILYFILSRCFLFPEANDLSGLFPGIVVDAEPLN